MRLIRVGWPILPALVAMLLIASPGPDNPAVRSPLLAIPAVGLSVAVTSAYIGSRVEPLLRAAERVATGEADVEIPSRNDYLGRRLRAAITTLAARVAAAQGAAPTALLTALPNRSSIIGALFIEVERSLRYRRPLAVAFAAIDHFKTLNDPYGHEAGDVVLRGVAEIL